ncbi:hypothetical protein DSM104299_01260 [Baekduia alba]|uniref:hypothetical protein n=1 Tax=Baekduia alba TaxID=2997333 RepID=UPI00234219B0|nr:hypothetical protein [Baekduia alba]WCB92564.1 hypothetical protein DSM104299_01260 [Baekduia alba]
MPVRRPLAAVVALAATLALAPTAALGQDGEPPADTNPCDDPILTLECPNLRMAPPSDLHVRKVGKVVRLLATNRIVNVGAGPLELRTPHRGNPRTTSYRFASATQVVRSRSGAPVFFPLAGWIYWKAIPGQGHYWKFWRAARFELWTLDPDGARAKLQRTGPKLSYCFRDLKRVRTFARSPKHRAYPACSQSFGRKELRLGVSPGWADIYPSTYDDNWISVTGLRGCFAFVHRADPLGDLVEEREDDNIGERVIQLPPRHDSVAPRDCPRKRSP